MTDQEMQIAIAEMCGYRHMPNAVGLMWSDKENRAFITPGSPVEKARLKSGMRYEPGKEAPLDYLNDLNAMHEAERTLSDDAARWKYMETLAAQIEADCYQIDGIHAFKVHCATARQRAEALLRTLGKWRDSDKPSQP